MKKGIVKFYNNSKGYGFIKEEGTEEEIFVHASGLAVEINKNDKVRFEVQPGRRGMNAINVKIA